MDRRRNDTSDLKRDQHGVRDAQNEVIEEINQATKPRVENANRDRARGDRDRSGIHHDVETGGKE